MPRRLLLTLIALGLTMALTAAPVSAGGGSLSIGDDGLDGEIAGQFSTTVGSGSWNEDPSCDGVVYENVAAFDTETRTAYEFPLAGLPANATITSVTLSLDGRAVGARQVEIYGYAGDGAITQADILVSGTPVVIDAEGSIVFDGYDAHDVTSLVTAAAVTAGWAGFSLRLAVVDGTTGGNVYGCPDDDGNGLTPLLSIQYDLPNPPTPAASLLDAATADPVTGSPLEMLGFALLLLGSLGTLILVNAQGVVRRRG